MKFTKKSNRRNTTNRHSKDYINERRNEMYQLLANCETEAEKSMIIDAFNISIRF